MTLIKVTEFSCVRTLIQLDNADGLSLMIQLARLKIMVLHNIPIIEEQWRLVMEKEVSLKM